MEPEKIVDEKTVKITVAVPESLKKDLKVYAAQTGRFQNDIIVTAVREHMKSNPA